MGAAGNVTVYRLSDIEREYAALWPDNDLREDWRYLDTITAELDGERWVLDYADDQGFHEGSGQSFWFRRDLLTREEAQALLPPHVDHLPGRVDPERVVVSRDEDGRVRQWGDRYRAGQVRVLVVLQRVNVAADVEVWT